MDKSKRPEFHRWDTPSPEVSHDLLLAKSSQKKVPVPELATMDATRALERPHLNQAMGPIPETKPRDPEAPLPRTEHELDVSASGFSPAAETDDMVDMLASTGFLGTVSLNAEASRRAAMPRLPPRALTRSVASTDALQTRGASSTAATGSASGSTLGSPPPSSPIEEDAASVASNPRQGDVLMPRAFGARATGNNGVVLSQLPPPSATAKQGDPLASAAGVMGGATATPPGGDWPSRHGVIDHALPDTWQPSPPQQQVARSSTGGAAGETAIPVDQRAAAGRASPGLQTLGKQLPPSAYAAHGDPVVPNTQRTTDADSAVATGPYSSPPSAQPHQGDPALTDPALQRDLYAVNTSARATAARPEAYGLHPTGPVNDDGVYDSSLSAAADSARGSVVMGSQQHGVAPGPTSKNLSHLPGVGQGLIDASRSPVVVSSGSAIHPARASDAAAHVGVQGYQPAGLEEATMMGLGEQPALPGETTDNSSSTFAHRPLASAMSAFGEQDSVRQLRASDPLARDLQQQLKRLNGAQGKLQ